MCKALSDFGIQRSCGTGEDSREYENWFMIQLKPRRNIHCDSVVEKSGDVEECLFLILRGLEKHW